MPHVLWHYLVVGQIETSPYTKGTKSAVIYDIKHTKSPSSKVNCYTLHRPLFNRYI